MSASHRSRSVISWRLPAVVSSGAKGWTWVNAGQLIASISAAAFSFIVQLPSGIIVRSRARSLSARVRRYRIIDVSDRCWWNTGWVR